LGRAYLATRQTEPAAAAIEQALSAAPGNLEALQLQARLMASRGDLAPAIERLQALIAQHPQADSTWLTLADLQLAAGQT
ncbi:tetratricopeptide repeat protein, partial [Escherichia coli]